MTEPSAEDEAFAAFVIYAELHGCAITNTEEFLPLLDEFVRLRELPKELELRISVRFLREQVEALGRHIRGRTERWTMPRRPPGGGRRV